MTHPTEHAMGLNSMGANFLTAANDPAATAKAMADSALQDPSEFGGKLLPEAVGSKGLGAAAGGARGAAGAARLLDDLPRKTPRDQADADPHGTSRSGTDLICEGDPVDVATGRMVLPQTDLVLSGSLPLIFGRTFESARRSGRWFGPTWASTVDQRLEIDAEGLVLVGEDGSLLTYPHPAAPGRPVLPSLGRRWPLVQEPDGTYTVTDPATGHIRHFSATGLLVQLSDRNGAWISYAYDEQGTPLSITHSGGYDLALTVSDGRITGLSLADGTPVLRYGYTEGHLTEVTNSSGIPLRFTYDPEGRITSWTDTNDRSFHYVYDDRHRCVAQSGGNGHLDIRFAYGDGQTTVTDSLGARTLYTINDRAQVVAETDPAGAVTTSTYDLYNRLLSRTDPLGHTTGLTYDDQGLLRSVSRPDGREARAEYNALGLPVKAVDPDGTVVRQTYDERGNRTSITDPAGATTRFSYDERGHLASVTDALGHVTTVECDAAGRVTATTDPLGARTAYTHDAFGRPTVITNPLGRPTRLTWSAEGHLLHRTHADGTSESWTYDGEGNCLSHTDAAGGVTSSEYGDFDLLTSRTTPDGARYTFTHDTELRLTSVTDPLGLTWSYAYDPTGRLASETDYDGRTTTYTYDVAGRLTARTNAVGATTRYEHNALGQVTRKTTPDGSTTYTYDASDALAAATSATTTVTWLRDGAGRLRSETVNGRTVTYDHDLVGRRTARATPTGAESVWTYDPAGRRATLTTSGRTLTFERDAAGRELTRTLTGAGAAALTQQYDTRGRLTTQRFAGLRRDYAYRADGHVTAVDDRHFTLDTAGRVTAVEEPRWSERYAYDHAGNQTSATWPERHPGAEARGERTYEGTRITRAGAYRYEYDALGRVTLRRKTRLSRKPETWRYEWNAEDQLAAVITPDGTVWRYTYDPLGRRTAKQRLSPTGEVAEEVLFTWDGTTLCEQTTDARVTLTWTHDGLHPLTQAERVLGTTDDRFFSIVTDLVGTPTHLLDEDGAPAWHTRRTLWGTTSWNRDATTYTPLRFPGQYFDPETGLHHNVFRTYDPATARYLTPDPLGLAPSPNPRAYVPNPYTWSDPLGLAAYEIGKRDAASQKGNVSLVADKIAAHASQRSIAGVHPDDVAEYIEDTMRATPGIRMRNTPSGTPRWAWWDDPTQTMIIREGDNGTFMQPSRGYDYFLEQINGD
ncbi:type IV secretion protein Rhs [Streptomyces bambusae]|uniref:Type IV secretion protein Rhs n=2 Tax=Streptomyces bambusae TaxID=1550616 RepID=A0ABS6YZI0_9ACTN|nr:type IV secretion protein Rhs [Streptomyces bambusae]